MAAAALITRTNPKRKRKKKSYQCRQKERARFTLICLPVFSFFFPLYTTTTTFPPFSLDVSTCIVRGLEKCSQSEGKRKSTETENEIDIDSPLNELFWTTTHFGTIHIIVHSPGLVDVDLGFSTPTPPYLKLYSLVRCAGQCECN